MSERAKPPIRTDMMNLIDTPDKGALLGHYYRHGGALLYMATQPEFSVRAQDVIARHGGLDVLSDRIDQDFIGRIREQYGLPSKKDALNLFYRGLRNANATVLYVLNSVLPEDAVDVFGLRSEIAFFGKNPSDRLIRYLYEAQDDVERFQVIRQLILGEISADFFAHLDASQLDDVLYRQQVFLNKRLFDRSRGIQLQKIDSWHHNVTNEVIEPDMRLASLGNAHMKTHWMYVRYVPGIGHVLTQPRIKDPRSVAGKGYVKAMNSKFSTDWKMSINCSGKSPASAV